MSGIDKDRDNGFRTLSSRLPDQAQMPFVQGAHRRHESGVARSALATVPDEFRWEWLTIPHIFASPFYCYAYSFGNLLVLALYRMYKEQGASFVPKYMDLLATGGSEAPQAILSKVGVDMTSEAFWQSGFDTIREMVEQLEETM